VGPVLAAQFGYLPGMLWILIGATLGGGVHDAVVMFSSIRRGGKSVGQMLKEEVNPFIGLVAMISLLAIMTVLLAVLGLVVVKALAESPWGLLTIALTIPIAMVMGLAMKSGRFSVKLVSALGVIALLGAVVAGKYLPETWKMALTWQPESLAWAIMIYGFAASVLPVWLLLAPRDYLSTFMKLGTVALLGIFIVIVMPPIHMPAITKFIDGSGWVVPGPVFPFVCITIACGAVSGFHCLISSGTTPKLLDRESGIRSIGYGAMITEMLVALMAIIAACALQPGQYFAVNTPVDSKDPASIPAAIAKINAAGFPVTLAEMQQLQIELDEPKLIGKTGGAPTFAVGMAHMFAKVFPGNGMLSLWYHFAIMFEALFILTTLDAGTRVGRFILQDLLGQVWKPLGDTRSWLGNVTATALLVSAWGFFLYQGAIDPAGIANSLWPIFGISNQLLAVIAFCLGTTVLIKMGRARYAFVTLVPLTYLSVVTFTAGIMKLFSAKAAGFLPALESAKGQLAAKAIAGVPLTEAKIAALERAVFNLRIDIGVTALFLVAVLVIVSGCAMEWISLVRGTKTAVLRESPYVALPDAA
jgi:carbon starvation protein